MIMKIAKIVTLLMLGCSTTFSTAGPYKVFDIGNLTAGYMHNGLRLNDSCQITGTMTTQDYSWYAGLWQDGTLSNLGTLTGGTGSHGSDINNAGTISGYGSMGGRTADRGFYRNNGGGLISLGDLGTNEAIRALAINNSNTVAGYYDPAAGGYQPFTWTSSTGFNLITRSSSHEWDWACDISNSGRVIGYGLDNITRYNRSWYWTPSSGYQFLTNSNFVKDMIVTSVNSFNKIVGYADNNSGVSRAFRTDNGGSQIIDLCGTTSGEYEAKDINDSGEIIGEKWSGYQIKDCYGGLWDRNGVFNTIDNLMIGGWGTWAYTHVFTTYGINNMGDMTVSCAKPSDPDGVWKRALLWKNKRVPISYERWYGTIVSDQWDSLYRNDEIFLSQNSVFVASEGGHIVQDQINIFGLLKNCPIGQFKLRFSVKSSIPVVVDLIALNVVTNNWELLGTVNSYQTEQDILFTMAGNTMNYIKNYSNDLPLIMRARCPGASFNLQIDQVQLEFQ